MYHSVNPFVRKAFLANVPSVMCCWSGPRPLASGTSPILNLHQISSQISYCCPESWRFYNNVSEGPLSTPSAHRWGRCWECQLKFLHVCLGGCCVAQPRPLEPLPQVKGGQRSRVQEGLQGPLSQVWSAQHGPYIHDSTHGLCEPL